MPDCSRKSRLLWRCSLAGGPIGWRRFWTRGEIITNWAAWPSSLAFKLVFKLTGASLGLDVSTMALLFIRGKKPAVKAYFEGKLASHPPTRLVPCHGDVLFDPNLKTRLAEVIGRRLG